MLFHRHLAEAVALLLMLPGAAAAAPGGPGEHSPRAIEGERGPGVLIVGADGAPPIEDQGTSDAEEEADEKDEPTDSPAGARTASERMGGPSVAVGGEVEMGSGTFVINEASRNEYIAWNGSLLPAYTFKDRTRIQLSLALSQELTQNDGDTYAHQLLFSDPRLGISRPIYTWDESKTQIKGEIGAYAPLSLRSQFERLYTAFDVRLTLSQPVGKFYFAFRTSFRKNFHQYTTPILSEEDLVADQANGLRTELAREGGNERVGAGIAIGLQNNVSHSWSNRILAAYDFTEKLSLSLLYALAHGWSYESYPQDELTAPGAQSGSRRGDSSSADISLAYQALDNLELAGGVRTLSTPRTADDKALRFPFYEFSNAELNLSVFYLSVTVTEKIPL